MLNKLAIAALLSLLWVGVAAADHNQLAKNEIAEGWILLFDGETTFGWRPGEKANWKVADGVISVSEGEPNLLATTSEFADFELKLNFRAAADTNSGVFLRTPPKPKDPKTDCYELNIATEAVSPFPTGSFVGRQKADGKFDATEWRTYEVTAHGGHFVVKIDGRIALDYTDPAPITRGHIGLQFNKGRVEFRDIKLRPLSLHSMSNGKDFGGWKWPGLGKAVYAVTPEGWINVKGGSGQLESNGAYGDFVLQLEARTNQPHTNSGIFFRSIPDKLLLGYECQIRNDFQDGDRTKPVDTGSGGFNHHQDARRVAADEQQWFSETLVVSGLHMAAWINGYQVSDWTDDRAPDPNPRKGSRVEAGPILIQGHDGTTDVSLRNLRIVELGK